MKKYIYQLLCSLFLGGTMVACAEDYMETDKGHDTLTLSVNQQELVLNEKNHSQEALALSWTTGTNYEAITASLIRWNWLRQEQTLPMLTQ